MSAAALPVNEAERLQALRALALLDSPRENAFDALVDCAARLTGAPIALVSLVDERRQWFKAAHGLGARETPREAAFCAHAIHGDELFEVHDAQADSRFADNPLVTGAPHIRFYAGQPLRHRGLALGTLCVIDTVPRQLDHSQREVLRQLAAVASELIEGRARLTGLREERARLADLSRASGDWMWEIDADWRYRWISGEFESVTGLTAASMIGVVVDDAAVLGVDATPRADGLTLHALLRGGAPLRRVVCAEATPRGPLYVSRSAVPVVAADGRALGWRGTSRDITAQIVAEARAHAQEELLHKLSTQLPGMMFQYQRDADGAGRYRFVSEGARRVFGTEPAAMLLGDLAQRIDMRDLPVVEAAIAASARRRESSVATYRVEHPQLGERWVETRAAPEPLPDGGTLWHGFSADVTERQRIELALRDSQARWSLAAEAAGIGVGELDMASGDLRFDALACRHWGLPFPHPRMTVADWLAIIDGADRDAAAAGIASAIDERGRYSGRVRTRGADGSTRHIETSVRVFEAPGAAARVLTTCYDVTERVTAEALRRDKEAAERANRAKSEFLSRVSHELRTPLNGILGFAQLMTLDRSAPLAPAQLLRLDGVRQSGQRLLALIDDLLELARIEQKEQPLALEAVDAAATLATCLALLQPLAAAQRVSLPAAPALAQWARAQPRALEQVLMNLLSNAIKYNRAGGAVRLHLETDDGWLRIAIEDDGPGLDAQQQAQLFQPFNRLGAEQQRIAGSGLGLVIARDLVEAMGGRLDVASQPGIGSTFAVALRACGAPPARDAARSDTPAAVEAAAHRGHVLYIEDATLNVQLMQEVFRSQPNWRLDVARDGAQGLRLARELRPDLLLIDMNLPDTGGVDLLRRLRADARTTDIPCVALSADAMREQIDAARAAGFDDYWTKPIDVPLLIAGLARWLGGSGR